MTILPVWMRSIGAAGATRNAARVCEQRRMEDRALEARLRAFEDSERLRAAAAVGRVAVRRADAA